MKKIVDTNPDFKALLAALKPEARNPCLLGSGWGEKLAWDPAESLVVESPSKFDAAELHRFIAKQQSKGRLVAGLLSYELGYVLHGLESGKDYSKLPAAVFFAYDNWLEKSEGKVYARFNDKQFPRSLESLKDLKTAEGSSTNPSFKPQWDRKSYSQAFSKIKNYIYDGVIYQINLAQELTASFGGNPRGLFSDLAAKNSARMKAYFEADGFELLSLSPERFIRTDGQNIQTTPIKGTRPRGKNQAEDAQNEQALLADEKEKAELNMITDLLRNDLGKVCGAGSVKVENSRQVEHLTSVIHTFSKVSGRLKDSVTPLAALLSMFPGGSITGCPKHRAMEIIDDLEQANRGFYCGSMVVIEPNGNLDSSILIRSIIKSQDRLSLSVGGGIVNDSVEAKEYRETLDKAGPLVRS